jgi:hypothetical protein
MIGRCRPHFVHQRALPEHRSSVEWRNGWIHRHVRRWQCGPWVEFCAKVRGVQQSVVRYGRSWGCAFVPVLTRWHVWTRCAGPLGNHNLPFEPHPPLCPSVVPEGARERRLLISRVRPDRDASPDQGARRAMAQQIVHAGWSGQGMTKMVRRAGGGAAFRQFPTLGAWTACACVLDTRVFGIEAAKPPATTPAWVKVQTRARLVFHVHPAETPEASLTRHPDFNDRARIVCRVDRFDPMMLNEADTANQGPKGALMPSHSLTRRRWRSPPAGSQVNECVIGEPAGLGLPTVGRGVRPPPQTAPIRHAACRGRRFPNEPLAAHRTPGVQPAPPVTHRPQGAEPGAQPPVAHRPLANHPPAPAPAGRGR